MDKELLLKNQLKDGSTGAFEDIFNMYHSQLCNYINTIILDIDESKGIAQECFIKLWEMRADIEKIISIKSYLYKSAYNTCLNRFKHEKVKEKYASEARYQLQEMFIEEFDNTYDQDLSKKVMAAVDDLPAKNKEVFTMRYLQGLNTAEVSEELGITPRTVETHVSNALKILRAKFSNFSHVIIVSVFLYKIYVFTIIQLSYITKVWII